MSEFVDYLHEVFRPLGPVRIRPMFGGQGVYHRGLMIALVADETLYLKTDDVSAPQFDALDLKHFVYSKNGKPVQMSYRLAPEDVFENELAAEEWGTRAYEAAVRGAQGTSPRTRKTRR